LADDVRSLRNKFYAHIPELRIQDQLTLDDALDSIDKLFKALPSLASSKKRRRQRKKRKRKKKRVV
jgi:ribosome-associated translation inhibitor RaiA